MSQQYPKSFNGCAACNYCGSDHQVNTFGQRKMVNSPTTKGKCLLQGGIWKGQEKQASATCSKWQAWNTLK